MARDKTMLIDFKQICHFYSMHIFLHILWHRYAYSSLSAENLSRHFHSILQTKILLLVIGGVFPHLFKVNLLSFLLPNMFFLKPQKYLSTWILSRKLNFDCDQMKRRKEEINLYSPLDQYLTFDHI